MSDLDTWLASAAPADPSPDQPTDPTPSGRAWPPVPDGPDGLAGLAGEQLCRDLAARYRAGATIAGLAKEHGLAVGVMRAALVAGGATIRPPVARRPLRVRAADPVSAAVAVAVLVARQEDRW
jgi:hypothetical protein